MLTVTRLRTSLMAVGLTIVMAMPACAAQAPTATATPDDIKDEATSTPVPSATSATADYPEDEQSTPTDELPTATATPTLVPVPTSDIVSGWLTYESERYGYQFSYPVDTVLSDEEENCIAVQYGSASVFIQPAGETNPCGRTGVGAYDITPLTETITITAQTYTANGYEIRERTEPHAWVGEAIEVTGVELGNDVRLRIQYGSRPAAAHENYTTDKRVVRRILSTLSKFRPK